MVVEGGAHTDHYGIDAATMGSHPFFLFWTTKAYPNCAGARSVDRLDHSGIFFGSQRAIGRRIGSCDLQAGEVFKEFALENVQGALLTAVEIDGLVALGSLCAVMPHQIGTVNPLLAGNAQASHQPGNRCTVRGGHVRFTDYFGKRGVLASRDHRVHVADADVATFSRTSPISKTRYCLWPVQ
ncbi:hypothetical protein D9M68_784040 [compost metagenome]